MAINTKERSLQKVSNLAHMTQICQHLIWKRQLDKKVHKPVLRYLPTLGVENNSDANYALDEEYKDIPDAIELGVMNLLGNDTDLYSINTTNPALLDLLADIPTSQATDSVVLKKSEPPMSKSSKALAKKDTSSVDLDSY
ncbi:hypothetical protein RhiXN_02371 [Rhizoctonia solani]|uniref:Uncharacterized protein n=1 Tax=Rhizoctonia solani TaxID=456999 RepID=A0A8H8T2R3_9AGAM|nr:uncharacterized protein RhiXN_02371 [Rhizoctonia solani]QRW27776.1 hypothetical protein RhiXN_02371 [Rhizoctonia solani]